MEIPPLIKGLITYLPGMTFVQKYKDRRIIGTKATANHAYNVWLTHLTLLHSNGFEGIPKSVAELGPGGSLGVGYAALLTGVESYSALDITHYVDFDRDLEIFDNLVNLFSQRKNLTYGGWIGLSKFLDENNFPSDILTNDILKESLQSSRVQSIRNDILKLKSGHNSKYVSYFAPWDDPAIIRENTVDLIISQSVLEHIIDLRKTYSAMTKWLRPESWMSHSIDYRSHGITNSWMVI
jgi:hypothetical protein